MRQLLREQKAGRGRGRREPASVLADGGPPVPIRETAGSTLNAGRRDLLVLRGRPSGVSLVASSTAAAAKFSSWS